MEAMNLPQPTPWPDILGFKAEEDGDCLLGNRWLCRGGSCVWVGGSGLGKSTLCLQAMMTWAIGLPFLGIAPKKPLRSLLIQAENDLGDVAEMAQGVLRHLKGTLNLTEEQSAQILANVVIVRDSTKTGQDFAKMAAALIGLHRPDLCWVDPLLSFIGGDALAQENMTMFLRHCLNPISVATGVTWMVMHHTPKPPKEGQGSQVLYDLAYAGIGSSELTTGQGPWCTFRRSRKGILSCPFQSGEEGLQYSGRKAIPTCTPASTPLMYGSSTQRSGWLGNDRMDQRTRAGGGRN